MQAMQPEGGQLAVYLDTVEVDKDITVSHHTLIADSYLRLQISDTGLGMAPEIVERVFEPFFTTREVGEGTGMGLAVVDGIIASHNGAIAVTSTPGQGSTFTVYLPSLRD
jgi:signal transduction histidine kinase